MLKLYDLSIEYRHDPIGLDEVQPRFGWKLESDGQNVVADRPADHRENRGPVGLGLRQSADAAEHPHRVLGSRPAAPHHLPVDRHRMGQPRRDRHGYGKL